MNNHNSLVVKSLTTSVEKLPLLSMQTKVHFNKLILQNPFGIHHGNYNYRYQIIVEIVASGYTAYGETVAIDYYGVDPQELKKACELTAKKLSGIDIDITTDAFYNHLLDFCPDSPFVRCAFDQAFIHLKAQIANQSVATFLNLPEPEGVISSITIGLSDSDKLIDQRLKEAWPFYKLKVKDNLPYELINRLNAKNKSWGIDANGSFDVGRAPKILQEVSQLGGIYAEQLCPKGLWDNLVENASKIPHLADESVTDLASAKKISERCDGFVLKLTKCGGITPTLKLIEYAKKQNKKLLAGCMTESSIGINHIYALSSQFDFFDLDGAFLISNDEEVALSKLKGLKVLGTSGKFL